MSRAFVLAIVGAESTGKSWLAQALSQALRAQGEQVACVAEYLREFCDHQGAPPPWPNRPTSPKNSTAALTPPPATTPW